MITLRYNSNIIFPVLDSLLESVILEHQIKCKCKEKDPIKHLKGGTQIHAEEYVEKLSFDHLKGATIGQSPNAHDYQKNAPKADIPKVLIKVRVKLMFGTKKADLLFSRDRGSAPQGPGSSLQRG